MAAESSDRRCRCSRQSLSADCPSNPTSRPSSESVGQSRLAQIQLADAVVAKVRDIEVVRAIEGNPARIMQCSARCRSAITRIGPGSVARDGRDDSRGCIHLADAVVEIVPDIEVVCAVEGKILRVMQRGAGRRAAVAGIGSGPIARHCRDDPCRVPSPCGRGCCQDPQ